MISLFSIFVLCFFMVLFIFCIYYLFLRSNCRSKEPFICDPDKKEKEFELVRELINNQEDLHSVKHKLNEFPYPFLWEQVFTKDMIENSLILTKENNIQTYDWTFIKNLLKNKNINKIQCKLPYSSTEIPYFSHKKKLHDNLTGYEKDAKFVEVFSKNTENIVLLDTNFNLLNSSESDIISKTYKDDQVAGHDVDNAYSSVDEESSSFFQSSFQKPLGYRCQRLYHNCQDKKRTSFHF